MLAIKTISSPCGPLLLVASAKGLREIRFLQNEKPNHNQEIGSEVAHAYVEQAEHELEEYFAGKRTKFDVALDIDRGTEFQRAVWNALCDIPYGETCSYKDIAEAVGRPKACRAVGGANNANPIPIIVPCHRVIGSSGKMVGYASGIDIKEVLLKLEQD